MKTASGKTVILIAFLAIIAIIASCSPASINAGTGSITIRISDDPKLIGPDGDTGITHYRYHVDNAVTSVDSGFIPKTGNDSFVVSDVQRGTFTVTAEAYMNTEGEIASDYILLSSETVTKDLKEGEKAVISIVFDSLVDELSGDITVDIILPDRLSSAGEGFSYSCTLSSADKPDEAVYSSEGNAVMSGSYEGESYQIMIPGQKPGSYIMNIDIAGDDGSLWTAHEAVRLFPVLEASGTVDMNASVGRTARPALSVTGTQPYMVSLSSTDPDAEIYYTLDGTNPMSSGVLYSSPLELDELLPVRAYAIAPGKTASEEISFGTEQPKAGHVFRNGGFIFYDRGPGYGMYAFLDGEPVRLSADEGWRYMVVDPILMDKNAWGIVGESVAGLGNGLGEGYTNTAILIEALGTEDCIWKDLALLRERTGIDYFIPSYSEAELIQDITREEPDNFLGIESSYTIWTSSEVNADKAHRFYTTSTSISSSGDSKDDEYASMVCRLI